MKCTVVGSSTTINIPFNNFFVILHYKILGAAQIGHKCVMKTKRQKITPTGKIGRCRLSGAERCFFIRKFGFDFIKYEMAQTLVMMAEFPAALATSSCIKLKRSLKL